MVIAGGVVMFLAVVGWILWGALYFGPRKPQIWHKVPAKVVQYEVSGTIFTPIVEFEYEGELCRCEAESLRNRTDLPIGSIVEISYCKEVLGKRTIQFQQVFYQGIVRIELPGIRKKEERGMRLFVNVTMGVSLIMTISAIILTVIGISNGRG